MRKGEKMKKVIIKILIAVFIIVGIICVINLLTISRKDVIRLLQKNKLQHANNIEVIEKELGTEEERYTKKTLKLDDVEYCEINMEGEECNYINWVNTKENKDTVVFINEKIYNSSRLEVEPILKNYSQNALEYFKDINYKYEYVKSEYLNGVNCYVVRSYKANWIGENYDEIQIWINILTGDCMRYEWYVDDGYYIRPEHPYSILEFTYNYDSVKIEEIKEPKEEDYPDFKYTYLY